MHVIDGGGWVSKHIPMIETSSDTQTVSYLSVTRSRYEREQYVMYNIQDA
jgi:hypothetical protein